MISSYWEQNEFGFKKADKLVHDFASKELIDSKGAFISRTF